MGRFYSMACEFPAQNKKYYYTIDSGAVLPTIHLADVSSDETHAIPRLSPQKETPLRVTPARNATLVLRHMGDTTLLS